VQAKNLEPQAKMMQSMVYYFPVITVVIAIGLPSGLAVYWVATTVFQIVQQYFVTGWGQLARWLPFLRAIPTPADKSLARGQREAIAEVEHDMAGEPAKDEAVDEVEDDPVAPGAERRDEGRRRGRRRRRR
jgi:YidC/Oxa1 family membrane protein insertase